MVYLFTQLILFVFSFNNTKKYLYVCVINNCQYMNELCSTFRKGANPGIADINGYLPLHHAVLQNHDDVVDVILDFFPLTYKVRMPRSPFLKCHYFFLFFWGPA